MGAQENPFDAGLDRLKALMSWWGMPNTDIKSIGEQQMQRFQNFVIDMQRALTETSALWLHSIKKSPARCKA